MIDRTPTSININRAVRTEEQNIQFYQEYYQVNKNKLLSRAVERVECECGSRQMRSNMGRHIKTNKHKEAMIQLES
jgi:Zn ribbon nucleic-acid-binding protein